MPGCAVTRLPKAGWRYTGDREVRKAVSSETKRVTDMVGAVGDPDDTAADPNAAAGQAHLAGGTIPVVQNAL